ncbi:MAG: amidohydrolase family protein [Bacillota bacterium]
MLVVKDGNVWTAGKPARPATIVVEGNRIRAVLEPGEPFEIPADATVIDARGKTVMPGLINAHTHICMGARPDPMAAVRDGTLMMAYRAAANAQRTISNGITTIRDLGAPDGVDLALKRAIEEGTLKGPRMLVAGKSICMTGGHGFYMGCEVDGADEARKAARQQLKAGVDVIKVMATGGVLTPGVEPGSPQLTVEELRAAIEEAHKAGRRTATHAQGTTGIANAIEAGVDSVEHGIFLNEKLVELMAEKGIFYVPTLAAPYYILKGGLAAGIPEFAVRKTERVWDYHRASFQLALKSGVRIGVGTDAGTPLNPHGTITVELELMVECGMRVADALAAATLVNAQCLGIDDRLGSIEAGKLADIIVVGGNPLEDLKALDRVVTVIKDGIVV